MKVMLIQPDREFYEGSFDVYGCMERSTLPLGLLYLASAIRKKHEVRILDCLMDENTRIYRKAGILHHSLDWEYVKNRIEDFNPDVIGITILFTAQEAAADRTIARIRKHFPKAKIVLGGCAISVNYEKYLRLYSGTYAIVGEGEKSLPGLLDYLESPGGNSLSGIPNLAYRKGRKIIKNPIQPIDKLDSLELPSYDLIDMERYLNRRRFLSKRISFGEKSKMWLFFARLRSQDSKRDVTMFTSRGCPFNCVFCSIHSQFGFVWRANSAEYVFSHMKLLSQRYGVNYIHFEDDNLTLDQKRFYRILDIMEKKKVNKMGHPQRSEGGQAGLPPSIQDEEERMRKAICGNRVRKRKGEERGHKEKT